MLNTKQLLQLVVDYPRKSACDMRFLSHIWEAFLRWCAMQFEAKVGVRVLGMGEFCYRRDQIADMEFLNPMFVCNESFTTSFGLHDRRPKTHAVETDSVDLDVQAIAGLTTDLLGEVIGKEVVDNAIHDIVERIGEVCAEPDQYGIITIDFGFANLFCENKSLEFTFGDARGGKPGVPPATGKSVRSSGGTKSGTLPPIGRPTTGASDGTMSIGGSSMLRGNRPPDAPLQRPHRPHNRPKHAIAQFKKDDLLTSHQAQLLVKDSMVRSAKDEETIQHLETLQRLRSEMVLDYSQREQRRDILKILSEHQQVQQDEKRGRDQVDRRVMGTDHWPFRTEEQVQQSVEATNRAQKMFLDKQLDEKAQKMAYLQQEAEKRQSYEQQQALEELKALEAERKGGRQPPPTKGHGGKASTKGQHGVERTLEDAFSRYEDYLHSRKEGIEASSSFQREQRYLSEQAELLKGEENRRRMTEMRAYLERQVRDKEKAKTIQKEHKMHEPIGGPIATLPRGSEIDAEEEAYVKMALKHALDGQVERKVQTQVDEKVAALSAEQQALGHVAAEMQEARYRAYSERREQEVALRSTWAKQQQLKLMEATLDKAEAA